MLISLLGFVVFTGILIVLERTLAPRWQPWSAVTPFAFLIGASLSLISAFATVTSLALDFSHWRQILASAALPACLLFLVPRRGRRTAAWLLALPLAVLVYADVVYFRYFDQLVPLSALLSARQLWDVKGVIGTLLKPTDSIALLLFAGAIVVFVLGRPKADYELKRRLQLDLCIGLLLLWLVVPPVVTPWREIWTHVNQPMSASQLASSGVLYAHLYDVTLHLEWRRSRKPIPAEQVASIGRELDARADWASQVEHFGIARGHNLLLIQVEALSTWVVDMEVGGEPVMPYLQSLRSRGLYYPAVLDQTSHSGTADAEYTVLNGLHPLPDAAICFVRAGDDFNTMAHALSSAGYSTASAHAYDKDFWNRAVMHPAYGFERSWFGEDFGPGETIGWGLADHVFFDRLIPRLQELPQPYFALAITLSMHAPYEGLSSQYQSLPPGEFDGLQLGTYFNVARYFDAALKTFMSELSNAGLLDNTVVALYGDHTPYVTGLWRLFPLDKGTSRDAEISFVPMLIILPENELVAVRDEPIGQIDIGPTLLHLLGIERPRSFLGRPALRSLNFAARWAPQSAFNDEVMFKIDRCFSRTDWREVDMQRCRGLSDEATRELGISYAITANNLATSLATSTAE